MQKIKIIIADDHKIFTSSLKLLIENSGDIEVIEEVLDGVNLIHSIENNDADIVLLDINMPKKNGIEVLTYFQKIEHAPKFIVISMYTDKAIIRKMQKLGANAYLPKNVSKEELINTIYEVHHSKRNLFDVNNDITIIKDSFDLLTKKEKEILKEISLGLGNQEIADKLYCSLYTIQTHRRNIHAKLNIKGHASLLNYVHLNIHRL